VCLLIREKIVTAFSTLNVLPAAQLANLNELGYLTMTPVQAAALPAILAGKDVRVQAKTGSGKTAAFGLGLLQHIDATCSRHSLWCCARPANWPIRSRVSCVVWRAFCRISKF
jgi:superfamily II DNA/RNA helicase